MASAAYTGVKQLEGTWTSARRELCFRQRCAGQADTSIPRINTARFGDMALIGEEGLDLAILPIGDYYTMGPDDAVRAVKLLKPRFVMPIHYNTFLPITQDAEAWAA